MKMDDMVLIVESLLPKLRRYSNALLRKRVGADAVMQDCDDLVQDCLERMIKHWHQRRTDGDAQRWAFAILHNLAINHVRQHQRRGRDATLGEAAVVILSQTVTPPDQEEGLKHQDLLNRLAALPEEHRSVLQLISIECTSYRDMARTLDIPAGTVMSRVARARKKLIESLDSETVGKLRSPHMRRTG
jgi:RNA polymerase sigma factor (sigma-70 family)